MNDITSDSQAQLAALSAALVSPSCSGTDSGHETSLYQANLAAVSAVIGLPPPLLAVGGASMCSPADNRDYQANLADLLAVIDSPNRDGGAQAYFLSCAEGGDHIPMSSVVVDTPLCPAITDNSRKTSKMMAAKHFAKRESRRKGKDLLACLLKSWSRKEIMAATKNRVDYMDYMLRHGPVRNDYGEIISYDEYWGHGNKLHNVGMLSMDPSQLNVVFSKLEGS